MKEFTDSIGLRTFGFGVVNVLEGQIHLVVLLQIAAVFAAAPPSVKTGSNETSLPGYSLTQLTSNRTSTP